MIADLWNSLPTALRDPVALAVPLACAAAVAALGGLLYLRARPDLLDRI